MNPVKVRYGNVTSRIEGGVLTPEVVNALSEACSYEVQGAEFMKGGGNPFAKKKGRFAHWDGKKRLYHKGHRTFGTGLVDRVTRILKAHGYSPELSYEDDGRYNVIDIYKPMGEHWIARDYQGDAIRVALKSQRGMIQVATGGGKTVIAGHIIKILSVQTVFLVHTKDLLYQAKTTFADMFGEDAVGQIGDGIVDPRPVTICTIQTAAKALEVDYETDSFAEGDETWKDTTHNETNHEKIYQFLRGCGLVFVDECHRVAAPTAVNVVSAITSAPFRFGLSASPWRDDGADLQLEAIFGDTIIKISATSLIEAGHLVTPYIRFRSVPPGRFAKSVKYSTIYEQYIVNNDERNRIIVDDFVSKVARGLPTMALVRHISHGRLLADSLSTKMGFTVPFLSGKDDSATRNSVINDLRRGALRTLVATTIADEGLDIKPLSGLVQAGGGKSSTRALQRVGRVLRPFPGKRYAEVSDFEDNARFLYDHSQARAKIYASEPGFVITDI